MADEKFLRSEMCTVAILSELLLLLSEAYILGLAAIAEEKSRQGIRSMYVDGKRADLFRREYALLSGFIEASEILTKMLNML